MGLFNHFPYTNFHELNIDWAIDKIKELVAEGEALYAELREWKTCTDADLAAWKEQTLSDLSLWEANIAAGLESWKHGVEIDFAAYELQFQTIKTACQGYRERAEAWAVGQINGEDVPATDDAYQNNAKYWAGEAADSAIEAASSASSGVEALEKIAQLKTDIDNDIYGVNSSFTVTAGAINKFPLTFIEGESYTVTNNTGVNISVILYDSEDNQTVIRSQLADGASETFTVDNANQVKIGGWVNAGADGTIDIVGGLSITDNFASVETDIASLDGRLDTAEEDIDNLQSITTSADIDVTNDLTNHSDEFLNYDNTIYTSNQWDYYTYPVHAGEKFDINTAAGGTARGWNFRDANGNLLSMASYSGDVEQRLYENVTAPADAATLYVNNKKTVGYAQVVRVDMLVQDGTKVVYNNIILPEYLDRAAHDGNILYGKTLCCCGDSITYGADMDAPGIVTPAIKSYQYSAYTERWTQWEGNEPAAYGYQIAARNNMIFYNGGVSGATVQGSGIQGSNVPGFSKASGEYTLLPDSIDYLTLFYGWNDTAYGTLGTIADATNDSFYGGYNVVLPYLIDKYPYAKIALIVPFGSDANHREAVRLLANKWGLACFDMYQGGTPLYYGKESSVDVDATIVTENRAKFQANGAHPNFRGHYQISTMLEHFLRGI